MSSPYANPNLVARAGHEVFLPIESKNLKADRRYPYQNCSSLCAVSLLSPVHKLPRPNPVPNRLSNRLACFKDCNRNWRRLQKGNEVADRSLRRVRRCPSDFAQFSGSTALEPSGYGFCSRLQLSCTLMDSAKIP